MITEKLINLDIRHTASAYLIALRGLEVIKNNE
jgi:hypothetical protein